MFCFSSRSSSDTFSSSSPFPGRPFAFPVLFWHFKGGVGAASEMFQGIIYDIMAKIQKLMIPIFRLITFAATFCPVMLSFRMMRGKIVKFIYEILWTTTTHHFVSLYLILFETRGPSRLTCCHWPPAWSPGPGICGSQWLGSRQPPPRPPAAADQARSRKAEIRI